MISEFGAFSDNLRMTAGLTKEWIVVMTSFWPY